jgi:hypothetical protein
MVLPGDCVGGGHHAFGPPWQAAALIRQPDQLRAMITGGRLARATSPSRSTRSSCRVSAGASTPGIPARRPGSAARVPGMPRVT